MYILNVKTANRYFSVRTSVLVSAHYSFHSAHANKSLSQKTGLKIICNLLKRTIAINSSGKL